MTEFDYPLPVVTVDAALLTLLDGRLHVALHRRDNEPFAGKLALPGGVIHLDKDGSAEDAIRRVLANKTGFAPRYLEQLQVFSGATRDPRWWTVAITFVALVPLEDLEAAGEDVFQFYDVDALPADLAFDHAAIIAAAVSRVRNKSSYSTMPCALLPEKFTLTQLQRTYEAVLQTKLAKASFRRRLNALDVLVPTDEYLEGGQRPAQLFKFDQLATFEKMF